MVRYVAFLCVFILYAILSNPTPDMLGWVEYAIGAGLIIGVGFGLIGCMTFGGYPLTLQYHRIFLGYMMAIPLLIGVSGGNVTGDIVRDMLPVICLVLPLLFYVHQQYNDLVLFGAVLIGAAFSMRYVLGAFLDFYNPGPLLYLANSPLVPFATIMGFHFLSDINQTSFVKRMVGAVILGVGFIAMALMMQRAPLALSILACCAIWGIRLPLKPLLMIGLAFVAVAVLFIFQNEIGHMIASFSHKTTIVGWNNRTEELQAVMAQSSLWGHGWGALWQSPAVADIWVRYTHNIISYYWLKTGVIGGLMAVGFVLFWTWQICILIRHKPAIGMAVAVPFLIHVTLYTGFKTLDFAILLALAVTQCPTKQAHANQS